VRGEVDLDAFMVCAAHARPKMDVDAEHLSKIWKIDLETAQRTLEVTTQRQKNTPLGTLTTNYSTNNRMLRYKRIDKHFFMDIFLATKNVKKGGSHPGGIRVASYLSPTRDLYMLSQRRIRVKYSRR
jgi:hypothetical protein